MQNSEIKSLMQRVLTNLEADLAFAEDALKDQVLANAYVVTLDKNHDAIMRVDLEGRGNFTGTLSTCRLFTLRDALNAIKAVKALPKNAEHLENATLELERVTDVCKRVVEKLPEQIAYTKEALAKA